MNIEILYEDADLVVINKPAGLVVHGDGKNTEPTLVDWLLDRYPDIESVGEQGRDSEGEVILRSGIVHRLDRETSGVMIIAKNQKSFEFLKKQFHSKANRSQFKGFSDVVSTKRGKGRDERSHNRL